MPGEELLSRKCWTSWNCTQENPRVSNIIAWIYPCVWNTLSEGGTKEFQQVLLCVPPAGCDGHTQEEDTTKYSATRDSLGRNNIAEICIVWIEWWIIKQFIILVRSFISSLSRKFWAESSKLQMFYILIIGRQNNEEKSSLLYFILLMDCTKAYTLPK
jgi:hypothetical protein